MYNDSAIVVLRDRRYAQCVPACCFRQLNTRAAQVRDLRFAARHLECFVNHVLIGASVGAGSKLGLQAFTFACDVLPQSPAGMQHTVISTGTEKQ